MRRKQMLVAVIVLLLAAAIGVFCGSLGVQDPSDVTEQQCIAHCAEEHPGFGWDYALCCSQCK